MFNKNKIYFIVATMTSMRLLRDDSGAPTFENFDVELILEISFRGVSVDRWKYQIEKEVQKHITEFMNDATKEFSVNRLKLISKI